MRQFAGPAPYGARVPLDPSVAHVPGEPVPVGSGPPGRRRALRDRLGDGKALVDEVVPAGGPGAAGVGGFQAEGLMYDGASVPPKGVHPRNRHLTVAAPAKRGEPVHPRLGAAADPAGLHAFGPTHRGDVRTAGDRPLCRCASADLAVPGEEV
jgi:alpha-mannosidase